METEPTGEFPHPLAGIQFGTVRRQEIKGETLGSFLPPVSVQLGMVVFGVVGNDHYPSRRAGADGVKVFQELPTGHGVELARLASEEEFAVAHPDGPKVAHALAGGMMEQHRVLGFGRDPHPAARTVLLKVHFVHSPEINAEIEA